PPNGQWNFVTVCSRLKALFLDKYEFLQKNCCDPFSVPTKSVKKVAPVHLMFPKQRGSAVLLQELTSNQIGHWDEVRLVWLLLLVIDCEYYSRTRSSYTELVSRCNTLLGTTTYKPKFMLSLALINCSIS
ncbi:hypothetical protein LSH36_366g04015, partial [Paralvinella palmiformis]